MDFLHDVEGSRVTINRWVAERTEEKIPELLVRGILAASPNWGAMFGADEEDTTGPTADARYGGAAYEGGFHLERELQRFQNLDGFGDDFGANAVTRQNCDFHCLVLYF